MSPPQNFLWPWHMYRYLFASSSNEHCSGRRKLEAKNFGRDGCWLWQYCSRQVSKEGMQNYCKVASSNMSRLDAHVGIYILHMKGIFDL